MVFVCRVLMKGVCTDGHLFKHSGKGFVGFDNGVAVCLFEKLKKVGIAPKASFECKVVWGLGGALLLVAICEVDLVSPT